MATKNVKMTPTLLRTSTPAITIASSEVHNYPLDPSIDLVMTWTEEFAKLSIQLSVKNKK